MHLDHYAGPEPTREVLDLLQRRAGKNPAGFPVYRLVRSEYVFEQVAGAWNEWDADLNVQDRGGIVTGEDGRPTGATHRPDRVICGLVENRTYSHLDQPGWMLERWQPAEYFGSPQVWNNRVLKGTTLPLLGPYPHDGAYILIVGPFPLEPSAQYLDDFIAHWEQQRESFPASVEEHIKMRVEAAMKRDERECDHAIRENTERLNDSVKGLASSSLEAGRWRSKMAERAGVTSHVGN